ncbi:hypothetical protein [Actinotalea sp. Marseille-Q4924]|uniref:hypothetical protein n=1 Tax=Actinotalea sp. Marseille-Q4924 TaxID=2866571 RepID=UPI001CE43AFE|nr:hypothetical protein [Actinotalea sp. Marseille-Q4924]
MSATRNPRQHRRWSDLSGRQRASVVAGGTAQLALAAAAWVDLAWRPGYQVRGRKPVWAAVIAISWVGPVLYFLRGISHHAEPIP